MRIAEARGPQGPLEPFGQFVGGLGGGIGIRKGFLTDEFALRRYKSVLDDEVFLGHRMGSNHLDVPSHHCHLRRMGALLAGLPPGRLLGIDKSDGKSARRLYRHGTP